MTVSNITRRSLVYAFILLLPSFTHAASLYMCRSYGGGTFWSNVPCGKHNALVERIVNVPDNLPFDQQVQLGEQARSDAQKLRTPQVEGRSTVKNNAQDECKNIDERIYYLDSLARQPQSAQTQDRISEERKQLRDRQFRMQCR